VYESRHVCITLLFFTPSIIIHLRFRYLCDPDYISRFFYFPSGRLLYKNEIGETLYVQKIKPELFS
jgi:hypothetical protein